jgi:type II secretory pathway component PulK
MSMQSGQALVSLLFVVLVAIMITSTAAVIVSVNAISTNKLELGNYAYSVAESGIENALVRLLRDPDYPGEVLTLGSDTASVTVTGGATNKVIRSIGTTNNFQRTIEVTATYNNSELIVTSWRETY